MVLPCCVTLVGFLVPVLVIPLGLLALRVLGVVAIYMMVEPAQISISVRYSFSSSFSCVVVDVSFLVTVVDFVLCTIILNRQNNLREQILTNAYKS